MSQVRTIFKNMSWLLISQIIASVCGFIWTMVTARYLGVNEYGILGFAISLTGILSITVDLGIQTHVVRHVATDYDSAPKYLGNILPLKCLLTVGSFILTTIILILLKSNELTITISLLFTIEMVIKSFINLLNGTFQAFEEGKYQGIGNSLLNLLLLLFILIAAFTDFGIYGITISYILANIIALIYLYHAFINNITKPKFEFDKTFCKKIIIASLPFTATIILYSIYYSIDVVMLNQLVGDYATGIYNATYKLISVLTVFYSVYGAVVYPVMSKLFKNDKKLLITSFEKSLKYLMMVIIPLAFATMYYSTDIIFLIYGHEYDAASSVLSILIWTVCLLFVNGVCNNLLNASYKEVTITKIYAIAAVFNVILNFFMIPDYSYIGAATATVLSDLLIMLIQLYVIHRLGYRVNKKLYSDLGKIIIGSGVLGIVLYYLDLNMWVAIPVGIIIYLVSITVLKFFDDDDKYVIKEILNKN